MKLTTKYACRCGFHTLMKFKKPGFLNPTFGSVTCDGCESRFLIKFTTPKDKTKIGKQLDTEVRIIFESETLKLIIGEEEESKKETKDPKDVKESHEFEAEVI